MSKGYNFPLKLIISSDNSELEFVSKLKGGNALYKWVKSETNLGKTLPLSPDEIDKMLSAKTASTNLPAGRQNTASLISNTKTTTQ